MTSKISAAGLCLGLCAVVLFAAEPAANKNPAAPANPAAGLPLDAAAKPTPPAAETSKDSKAADAAWKEVLALSKPPSPPADWRNGEPTEGQKGAFKKQVGEAVGIASEKAREFYLKFPQDPRALEAQKKERSLLMNAIQMGQTNRLAQLRLNPILSDEEKFQQRVNELNKKALEQKPKGMDAVLEVYFQGTKELRKEFPGRDELPSQLLGLLRYMEPKKKAEAAKYIVETTTDESIVNAASVILKTLPGQPVAFKFTAIDGREIDTSTMKGKVLLIDFWATWCGPCLRVLPDMKKAYAKYQEQGFEIIGISGDRKLSDLQRLVKSEKIRWPQYYDKDGPVRFMEEYNIEAIPTMWLVDKKGLIRDTDPIGDLENKIKALLAEK